jgi:hypothetical protein
VGWDVIMINPANFIQYQAPDKPYDGKNDDGSSPLSAMLTVIDRAKTEAAPGRFVIYEGWADMGGTGGPFRPRSGRCASIIAIMQGIITALLHKSGFEGTPPSPDGLILRAL